MTERQHKSPVELMHAILACSCCPPDIRLRATNLLEKLQMDWLRRFLGMGA